MSVKFNQQDSGHPMKTTLKVLHRLQALNKSMKINSSLVLPDMLR